MRAGEARVLFVVRAAFDDRGSRSGEVLSPRSWRHIKRQIMYLIRGIMTAL